MSLVLPPEVEVLLSEYREAVQAVTAWKSVVEEKRSALLSILSASGYSPDRDRLDAPVLPALAGTTSFEVRPKVSEKLDQRLLAERYPEAFLACRTKTVSYSIVFPTKRIDDDE